MLKKIKKLRRNQKILIIFSATLLIACASFLLTNYKCLKIKSSNRIYDIPFKMEDINENKSIEFDFNSNYIRKIIVDFSSSNSFEINYNGDYANMYGNLYSGSVYDYCYHELGVCGIKIDTKVGKMKLDFKNLENVSDLNIERIYVDNSVYFNWNVFLTCSILANVLLLFIFNYSFFIDNKHILLFMMCFSIGLLFIITTHNITTIACDDEIHFERSNSLVRDNDLISISDYYMINRNIFYTTLDTFEEKNAMSDFLDYNTNRFHNTYIPRSNLLRTDFINYIPIGMTMRFLDTFNINKTVQYYAARLVQLLIYCLVVAYAVKIIPVKKILLMVISMFPQSIFLASSFSYDPTVTAFLILSFAIFVKEYNEKDKILSRNSALLFVMATLFGVFPKAIFSPMLLLMLLLPKSKFKSEKQCKYFKMIIIGLFIIAVASFALPILGTAGNYNDPRGGDTSLIRQIKAIISSPIIFVRMFTKKAIMTLPHSLISPDTIGTLSYYGSMKFDYIYILFAIALVISMLFDSKDKLFDFMSKAIIIILIVLINCAIWGSMYLVFTPVGLDYIIGVQPRYFIPIVLPSLFIISDLKFDCKYKKNTIMNICILLCFIGNIMLIFEKIIKVFGI